MSKFELVDYPHVVVMPYRPHGGFSNIMRGMQKDKEEAAKRELQRYTENLTEDNIRVMVEIFDQESMCGFILLRNLAYSHPDELPMCVSSTIIVLNSADVLLDLYPELHGKAVTDHKHNFDILVRVFLVHFPPFLAYADRTFFDNMETHGQPFRPV